MQISAWLRELFADIDRMDAQAFAAWLAEDGEFRFGSQPPAVGRAAVEDAVRQFFGMVAGLSHELLKEWNAPGSVVVEGQVTYSRKDGSQVTLPFVDVLDMVGRKVGSYKIYLDPAPLLSPALPDGAPLARNAAPLSLSS